jgi:prepilin peptidase CpaA
MNVASTCLGTAALVLALASAITDARTGLIPNKLTLTALAAAPCAAFAVAAAAQGTQAGLAALSTSILGAVCTALVPLALFVRGDMGGGDVKLLAALGALLGPFAGFNALTAGLLAASLFVGLRALLRGDLPRMLRAALRLGRASAGVSSVPSTLRLGPALCVGTLAAVFVGPHALIVW